MSRETEQPGEPIAVHTTEHDGRRVVVVVHPDHIVLRDCSDGQVMARHRAPYEPEYTACVSHHGTALLIVSSYDKVFALDLRNGTDAPVGSCDSYVTALAARCQGQKLLVAVGERSGSVRVFTLDADPEWSSTTVPAHQNRVLSVSLGLVRGRPYVVSCADDSTVTRTSLGTKPSRSLWELRWEEDTQSSTGFSCGWMPHGTAYPFNLNEALHKHVWNPDAQAWLGALEQRRAAVRECLLVETGRASLALVTGKDALHTMMTLGVVPQPRTLPSKTLAFAVPGRLAAAHPIRRGLRLALLQGSAVHIADLRLIHTWHWVNRVFNLLAFCGWFLLIRSEPLAWFLLPMALSMAFQAFERPTLSGIDSRPLADIDLHGEVIDVDFAGPDALVALSHRGTATFDLSGTES
ncbi:hypothetical protein [Streptomyces neyagawaensis]|uniref:hypothetical protein n=1 Tax=Streptomyces neyagawaensis TaxID=42238 RepID=UPI000A72BEDB|nr:hypothetical protein [Streptomyces neyagawaensis]MCL6731972.1 hypothetical protein [Streptomyces neyagawaensis]MDE1682536.1 hypothetical protein [Streptomyces neyagawaensis]